MLNQITVKNFNKSQNLNNRAIKNNFAANKLVSKSLDP